MQVPLAFEYASKMLTCAFYSSVFPHLCCCNDCCLCDAFSTGNVIDFIFLRFLFSPLSLSLIRVILQETDLHIKVSNTSAKADI